MIFSRKNKLFWGNLTLTGALIFGAPVFALADKAPDPSEIQGPVRKPQEENKAVQKNGDSDNLSGKTDGNNKDRETDYSEEGQISKPSYSYESGPGTEGFVDDSTDNTYGYYTIMGTTTVTLEEMTSLYEENGAVYPSLTLKGAVQKPLRISAALFWKKRNWKVFVERWFMCRPCWKPGGFSLAETQWKVSTTFPVLEQQAEAYREIPIRMCEPGSGLRSSI